MLSGRRVDPCVRKCGRGEIFGLGRANERPGECGRECGQTRRAVAVRQSGAGRRETAEALEQQIRIYRIDKSFIQVEDVLTLMEIFAVPYRAMVFV